MGSSPSFTGLSGKVCAITGGGGIIGSALSRGMASLGVRMAILDLSREFAENLAHSLTAETGSPAIGVETDVLDRRSLERARETIHAQLGPVELLINCAGGNSPKATTQVEFLEKGDTSDLSASFYGLDIEGFRRVFDLNFLGTVLPTMVLTQDMVERGGGAVLNVSSMNSFRPLTKIPAYSAAKASINNFTEWLAVHLAHVNVRVNAIAPGFFETNQNKFLLTDEKTGLPTARAKKILAATPVGAYGKPEDLCGAAAFLLSDMAGFITGVVLPIDGGFHAYSGV